MKLRRLFIVVLIFSPVISACAHPLDISLTTLQVLPSGLSATTYIHPYELSLLVDSQGLSLQEAGIPELSRILLDYFNEHFKIYGRKGVLNKKGLVFEGEEIYKILAGGAYLNFLIIIERNEYPVTFEVDLFVEFLSWASCMPRCRVTTRVFSSLTSLRSGGGSATPWGSLSPSRSLTSSMWSSSLSALSCSLRPTGQPLSVRS